ncbi:unnamed protein product, partial [Allacma fusca]
RLHGVKFTIRCLVKAEFLRKGLKGITTLSQPTHRMYLTHTDGVSSLQLATELEEDHQKIVGAIKSLQSLGDIVEAEQATSSRWELTAEGSSIVKNGSHEALVFKAVPPGEEGIPQPDLMKATGASGKIGMSKAIQAGWLKVKKEGGVTKLTRTVESIVDTVKKNLEELEKGTSTVEANVINDYKKRKLMQQVTVTSFIVRRGAGFTTTIEKQETELTPELIASGAWKTKKFKPYNFNALGTPLAVGHLHPLLKVRSEFLEIFMEMGFSEMPTNKYIESSFWNFDALFVPQKHPARDDHDTFFLSRPAKTTSVPEDYLERVKKVHSVGDFGSQGYRYEWKREEAEKNVLRTHTTAVSARMLHKLAQEGFKPSKFFSIDKVFRNETLDATHLAEFHQVEGVVCDRNITLGDLLGIIKEFFRRLGIEKVRFKPAYNPYTEPSMEVFAYHPGLKKWVEVGNSGMFRPELLLPMGIPPDVRCHGWGLSLERPTMIRYGIDNIRDLVGPRVDLQMVYNNPLCRLDKH